MGHLAYDIKESDLDQFFKGYGYIKDLTIKNGYGFVVSILRFISIYLILVFSEGKYIALTND